MPAAQKDFSTGGVVWDLSQKKVLLILVENLSGAHVWTFPKGHPEPGESDTEAALREVREETGWRCEVTKTITDVHYFYTHNKVTYDKTVRWFLMKPVEKVGEFDPEEVIEVRWASPIEATKLISYGSDKDLLKQTGVLL
jgi:diadenosine hexaphosphate hydrolase (ATP-forming)